MKKLDEAILEELARRGPGSRVELSRRAWLGETATVTISIAPDGF